MKTVATPTQLVTVKDLAEATGLELGNMSLRISFAKRFGLITHVGELPSGAHVYDLDAAHAVPGLTS